jgi:hypothetical protein
MHEKIDEQMDNLLKKVIVKASLETPSFDFTAQIMTQLVAKKQSQSTIYKPLISRFGLLFLWVCSLDCVFFFWNATRKPELDTRF